MNPVLADAIGLLGSATMVGAFVYSNLAKAIDLVIFNIANLVGSLMLILSLMIHFNMASMALEIVWAAIAIAGLAKALWTRRARMDTRTERAA